MTIIELILTKTLEQNADLYFEQAKKLKKKMTGALQALESTKQQLAALERKKATVLREITQNNKVPQKKRWYDKFRWFKSSEGYLVICGRDATTNEIAIKKYTEAKDLVFHAEMAGSPFTVVKGGQLAGKPTLEEAAAATAAFSRAWRMGLVNADIFCVKPEQVSKTAKAGESMGKGAFMIYGEKQLFSPEVRLGVGVVEGEVVCAPLAAVEKYTENIIEVVPGKLKASDAAKKIQVMFGGELDHILRILPPGEIQLINRNREKEQAARQKQSENKQKK